MLNIQVEKDKFERFVKVALSDLHSRARYQVLRTFLMEVRKEASNRLRGRGTKKTERAARATLDIRANKKETLVGFVKKTIPKRTTKGVGLSRQNIHWVILGTKERVTKTGKKRGKMKAYFRGVLGEAYSAAFNRALKKAEEKLYQILNTGR